jgi:histidyl-tRNA synthetase
MEKPSLPKGTRDFGPAQMAKRQFILERIKKVFQKYGFQPLETPAMENLSTLTGKYGDEGDQLLFKILNSGDFIEELTGRIEDFNSGELKEKGKRIFFDFVASLRPKAPETVNELDIFIKKELAALLKSIPQEYDFIGNSKLELLNVFIEREFDQDKLKIIFDNVYKSSENEILSSLFASKRVVREISEKGLRYDLTVPFARFVVMNRHEITFPFKRYQIQPVWRADRPQKGRYREFYQCDADVVGTDSLLYEAEIVLMIKEVFKALGILDYTIKINHRGILSGLAEICQAKENETSLFMAIDKLDKIGEEKVKEELIGRGFQPESLTTLFQILNFKGNTQQKIEFLSNQFSNSEKGRKGLADFQEVLTLLNGYGDDASHVEFDISLARGLSYYTGCIFEVKINNVAIGSVSGGGRYDNLTGSFGLEGVSGIGISFGVDRLYDSMEELKLFQDATMISSTVMICYFDSETQHYALKVASTLRAKNIATEVYPAMAKLKKQLDYANKKAIPYVIVIGSDEVKSGQLTFKNMQTGDQEKKTVPEIIAHLSI